jgi:hypothetical protein
MKSVGTFVRYRVCLNDSCITWPRQLETIESFAACNRPGTVRNGWYEFYDQGVGILSETSCIGRQLVDAGESVQFADLVGEDKKLAISCDVDEEDTATILIQYYDSNGQWVRTQNADGEWIDGEEITLPATGNYAFSSLEARAPGAIRVIKPVTNGVIRLWEHDVNTLAKRALSLYEPNETIPVYRRSVIPNLANFACCTKTDTCDKISVVVVGKIRFIPVSSDNDFLVIGHKEAIRLACQAIHKEESDMLDVAATYWLMAQRCLVKQLEHWLGHGAVQPMRVANTNTFGGAVPQLR